MGYTAIVFYKSIKLYIMKNSILSIYKGGMWLWDSKFNMEQHDCSVFTTIESMNDPQIAEHILLCNQYGFYPTVEFCSNFEITMK